MGLLGDLVEALPTLEENRAKIEMLLKTDLGFLTLPLSNIDPSWSIPLTRIAQQMDKNIEQCLYAKRVARQDSRGKIEPTSQRPGASRGSYSASTASSSLKTWRGRQRTSPKGVDVAGKQSEVDIMLPVVLSIQLDTCAGGRKRRQIFKK